MEKYLPILRNSPFFKGLSDNEILSILHCVNATVISKERASYIFRAGDSTEVMGLVVSGCVLVRSLGTSEYSVEMSCRRFFWRTICGKPGSCFEYQCGSR